MYAYLLSKHGLTSVSAVSWSVGAAARTVSGDKVSE